MTPSYRKVNSILEDYRHRTLWSLGRAAVGPRDGWFLNWILLFLSARKQETDTMPTCMPSLPSQGMCSRKGVSGHQFLQDSLEEYGGQLL